MQQTFTYLRPSPTTVTLTVMSNGYVILKAPWNLKETLEKCKEEMIPYLLKAMKYYGLGVAKCVERINTGRPTHPKNKVGRYFSVDGKLYRYDKIIDKKWRAPASDLLRILLFLQEEQPDAYIIQTIP